MKVIVTRRIPEPGMQILQAFTQQLKINDQDRTLSRKELLSWAPGARGVLSMLGDRVDAEFFAAAGEQLRVVANYAVGFNNIDIPAATQQGVMVTNTPGVLTDTTADLTWGLIISAARRIVAADHFTRQKKFKGWAPQLFLGLEVANQTLGIVGAGRIGQAVGKRAFGFNMKLLYHDRNPISSFEKATRAKFVELNTLLTKSDIITLHLPLTEDTRYLIDEPELSMMKKSALLINTARGPIVREEALVQALKNNQIAGAGLDVYENEPEIHPELFDLSNVTLLPHIGSATITTRTRMAQMAAKNLVAALSNHKPPNIVNPQVF